MRQMVIRAATCAALVVLAAGGCGGNKRPVVNLSGKVTFKGDPVPAGFINFMPDVTGGNAGEVKGFEIVDGTYDTAKGPNPGVYPGANKIMLSGFDGKAVKLWPKGKQIFNPIELTETVANGPKDFVVPESAGQNVLVVPTADPD
ncbi:MAG: hypothetical protein ACRC33_02100 [Gemmataceae bacterium]